MPALRSALRPAPAPALAPWLGAALVAGLTAACTRPGPGPRPAAPSAPVVADPVARHPSAALVLVGGTVRTLDPERPVASAVAIDGGRIVKQPGHAIKIIHLKCGLRLQQSHASQSTN